MAGTGCAFWLTLLTLSVLVSPGEMMCGDVCVNSTHYQSCSEAVIPCSRGHSCYSHVSYCLPNPPPCPADSGAFQFPNECERFYVCTKGTAFVVFCPDGLHFTKMENGGGRCAEPEVANCVVSSTASTETPLTTTSAPETESTQTETDGFTPFPSTAHQVFRPMTVHSSFTALPQATPLNDPGEPPSEFLTIWRLFTKRSAS